VGNVDVDLFPTGVLCGAIHRSKNTLYEWEELYGFPRALYRMTDDKRQQRWYSRAQILAILETYRGVGELKGKVNRARFPQFIAAVRTFFYTIDAKTAELKK